MSFSSSTKKAKCNAISIRNLISYQLASSHVYLTNKKREEILIKFLFNPWNFLNEIKKVKTSKRSQILI